jgi:ATP-dependent Clp protease adaptor protein ClpS
MIHQYNADGFLTSFLFDFAAGRMHMTISEPNLEQTDAMTLAEFDIDLAEDEQLERRWYVLIHNDDVTPFEYVLRILTNLFLLSEEMAEHVAQTAHSEGKAVVVVRPRPEAERLVKVARSRARLDGYPLTFSIEPEA